MHTCSSTQLPLAPHHLRVLLFAFLHKEEGTACPCKPCTYEHTCRPSSILPL